MRILTFLQQADRRILYVMLILAVTIPFFVPLQLPLRISQQTRNVYNAIEKLPPGSFVLVGVDWSAGTRGENLPQNEELIRHLMQRKLRFAMLAFGDPQGKQLGEEIAQNLGSKFGAVEGRDWVNFGYRVSSDMNNVLKATVQNIPGVMATDVHSQRLDTLPVMHGIHTAHDVALLLDITPSSTYQNYIQFVEGPFQVPEAVALTSVMVPEAYNYADSKQLIGLVAGLPGAAEYETLYEREYGRPHGPTTVSEFSNSASFAHVLIILFIVLGNVAMFMERAARPRREAAP